MSCSLDACVRAALDRYFAELDGALPQGVHAMVMHNVERAVLAAVMERTGGNQTRAAERLRVTFRALRYYVQKYGLKSGGPGGEGGGAGAH